MCVIVFSTGEPSQVAWLVAKVVVVVYIDTKGVGMLVKFHIPLTNDGGSIVIGVGFRASSNEVLNFFCVVSGEIEYITGPGDEAMWPILIVEC